MLKKSRGVFFLRSPKRRRQLRHRRTGLGDPETDKQCQFQIHMNLIYLLYLMECFEYAYTILVVSDGMFDFQKCLIFEKIKILKYA